MTGHTPWSKIEHKKNRYWHQFCFTGPEEPDALLDAAEAAGFNFEFGSTEPDADFVGLPAELDAAKQRIVELERELAQR